MKMPISKVFAAALAATFVAGSLAVPARAQDFDRHHDDFHGFVPGSIVLSGTVYLGNAGAVTPGEVLPFGCLNTGTATNPNPATVNVPLLPPSTSTTAVTVTCGYASDNGEAPNLNDNHNVWNNASSDGSFGVTSPIFLDNITTDGDLLGTLPIPSDQIVTSFTSKSELALNRSIDGRSITFMAYRGGVGCGGTEVSPTRPNLLDVSQSNTPGVCDPTNPVISTFASNPVVPTAYYRAVAEVDVNTKEITPVRTYNSPTSAQRLPNGNILVSNQNSYQVVEMDPKTNKAVWDYKPTDNNNNFYRAWRVKRR